MVNFRLQKVKQAMMRRVFTFFDNQPGIDPTIVQNIHNHLATLSDFHKRYLELTEDLKKMHQQIQDYLIEQNKKLEIYQKLKIKYPNDSRPDPYIKHYKNEIEEKTSQLKEIENQSAHVNEMIKLVEETLLPPKEPGSVASSCA
jgi:DNA repair exonuclease SbcCD ATPase subunit